MKASMRRSLGLESEAIVVASSDEPSDVVGIDVQELFGEVDAHDHHAPNVEDGDDSAVEIVCEDMEVIQSIADVLEAAGEEGASPVALAVAQESMQSIFSRYGVAPRSFAKEAIDKGQAVATKEALAYAREGMLQIANEGVGDAITDTLNRMRVNTQQFWRRRTTWRAEAIRLQKSLQSATGTASDSVLYTNRIRIAHMTTGDQNVLTNGHEMLKAVRTVHSTLNGVVPFLTGLTSLFTWFNSEKGKVDFNAIAANFKESVYNRDMLSISGPVALFGEESVMSKFGGVSNTAEEMMAIMRSIRFSHTYVWRVKDLDIQPLKPLSVQEMKDSIGDLVKVGEEIMDLYGRHDRELTRFYNELRNKTQNNDEIDLDMITSPIRYFRFRRAYVRILNTMLHFTEQAFDLNFMAATAMLDYYMWSLKNTK